jgi:hypothetical protein
MVSDPLVLTALRGDVLSVPDDADGVAKQDSSVGSRVDRVSLPVIVSADLVRCSAPGSKFWAELGTDDNPVEL